MRVSLRKHFLILFCFGAPLLALPLLANAFDYSSALNERYAPYAKWHNHIVLDSLESAPPSETWWRSPGAIRMSRAQTDEPLSGLHVALDPGHVGGDWAAVEGRNFKIAEDDFPVREGELVLEVAQRVKAKLVELGAEVTLLREKNAPINPKAPGDYYSAASQRVDFPQNVTWASLVEYSVTIERIMNRMAVVSGELTERARRVNEDIQPDALISLHINAAPWPVRGDGEPEYELVDSNHTHVLIFGCLSDRELSSPEQRKQLATKLTNASALPERELGQALGISLGEATALPPSNYSGENAVRLEGFTPYLWARNLLMLRLVECPAVLLEPYIANGKATYPRIQQALKNRQQKKPLAEDDILLEYADAVVAGLLEVYRPVSDTTSKKI